MQQDMAGLRESYRLGVPVIRGQTLYVHGTRSPQEALDEWPLLVAGLSSPLRRQVEWMIRNFPGIRAVVGHSLGASMARDSARLHGLEYRGYGRPAFFTSDPHDVSNLGDPVTWLLPGHHRLRLGHSLAAYEDA